METFPERIADEAMLDDVLSRPTQGVVDTMGALTGDIIILGAGGKMGPTMARMAKAAYDAADIDRRVIAVSRFSSPEAKTALEAYGVECIPCDLMEHDALAQLPDIENVLYMVGSKFGTTGAEAQMWAVNAWLPAQVCERYRHSRIVAFSTGNVYGLVPVTGTGSVETDVMNPQGEYAMSCLGRERILEHCSQAMNIPAAIIRLNYACELRYGVLVDVARWIWNEQPIDLTMGYLNAIWQGDANAMTLQAFSETSAPPFVLNVAGPETIAIQEAATALAERMGKPVCFQGEPAPDALLSDARKSYALFGTPAVPLDRLYDWIADWIMRDGASLGKPTHFEVRDGKF